MAPAPYSRKELRQLWALVDERWPKLDSAEAGKRAVRWRDSRCAYSRVRRHAIRLQLDAVVALALHGGLRRGEIFALNLHDLHPDNAYVVVWSGERWRSQAREVPFTVRMRERVGEWVEFRAGMAPDHDRPWLSLHAAKTAREPMKRYTFDKLLATHVGSEWGFQRLRDTAGVEWLRAGLTMVELQRLLGDRSWKATHAYAEALDVPIEHRIHHAEDALSRRLPLAA